MTEEPTPESKKPETLIETIEVAGTQVLEEVKRLIREGNVRRLHIKAKDSDFHMEMPVTMGLLVGGAVALAAPWLAILGVVGGLIAKVQIEVERESPARPGAPEEAKVEDKAAATEAATDAKAGAKSGPSA